MNARENETNETNTRTRLEGTGRADESAPLGRRGDARLHLFCFIPYLFQQTACKTAPRRGYIIFRALTAQSISSFHTHKALPSKRGAESGCALGPCDRHVTAGARRVGVKIVYILPPPLHVLIETKRATDTFIAPSRPFFSD